MYSKQELDIMPISSLLTTTEQIRTLIAAVNDSSVNLCYVSKYILYLFLQVARNRYDTFTPMQKENIMQINAFLNSLIYTTNNS
ncbi:hypothetical protein [Scale drop disease virus]|uniref:Uncharacterized protein n=1 Tax=Scale drop disease virus TaxID=1697349 RepID=A0A7D5UKW9_9VIRU|nr:hypothetical protein [Scale drop disease virus]QXJ13601.1 hypothetical protein PMJGCIOK_00034 [Scale drop disease virus]UNH60772.1 hypothetical protein SDDV_ORF103 [Scale drop disease virus]